MTTNPLGDFLRARRSRVDPASVGLSTVGRRRTPGLRREEVASRAGISVEYLVRLERGRDRNPSGSVLESLAGALLLDSAARAHLRTLGSPDTRRDPDATRLDPALVSLLDGLQFPAMVATRFFDLLAVNPAGGELYAGWSVSVGDNLARHLFLAADADRIYRDREELAAETVSNLRAQMSADGVPPRLESLVGELSTRSALFARLWPLADVRPKTAGSKRVWHPLLGDLDLNWSTLNVADAPGQMVVAYQGAPGSNTERQLRLLTRGFGDAASARL